MLANPLLKFLLAPSKTNTPTQEVPESLIRMGYDYSTIIQLNWRPVFSDGPILKSYIISWKKEGELEFQNATLFTPTSTSYRVFGLEPNTAYSFTITAISAGNKGEPSDEAKLYTGNLSMFVFHVHCFIS